MMTGLKSIFREALDQRQRWKYLNGLKRIRLQVPLEGIHLNYGNLFAKTPLGILHGGKVKLFHLQKIYPEKYESFNLIYLVSSAYPPFAEEWVQWAKQQGVKMIWNQNGVAYPAWAGPHWEKANTRLRRLLSLADYIIYQSGFCRESTEHFLGPVKVPWEILHNSVDLGKFFPPASEIPASPWIIITAGTHQQPERVFTALETLSVLKKRKRKVKLILAGKLDWPKAEQETQAYAQARGISDQVIRRPAFTQREAPELYRQAHICLHPKYKDPCPTVVIEAMACGLPVIGSRSGGLPELVGREGGILIDVPDSWDRMYYPEPSKIADAVEQILFEIALWRKKARKRAEERFSLHSWLNRHREIFLTVLSNEKK